MGSIDKESDAQTSNLNASEGADFFPGELGSLSAIFEDARRDTVLWLQLDPSAEESFYVLNLQAWIAELDRIVSRRIRWGQVTPDEKEKWFQGVAEITSLVRKAGEVRGNLVGKALARLVNRLANSSRNEFQIKNGTALPGSRVHTKQLYRGNPEVAKRSALVRNNPHIPAKGMCGIFEREKVSLPAKWLDAGFQTWSQAYKSPSYRRRIDTLVSKDRKKN